MNFPRISPVSSPSLHALIILLFHYISQSLLILYLLGILCLLPAVPLKLLLTHLRLVYKYRRNHRYAHKYKHTYHKYQNCCHVFVLHALISHHINLVCSLLLKILCDVDICRIIKGCLSVTHRHVRIPVS